MAPLRLSMTHGMLAKLPRTATARVETHYPGTNRALFGSKRDEGGGLWRNNFVDYENTYNYRMGHSTHCIIRMLHSLILYDVIVYFNVILRAPLGARPSPAPAAPSAAPRAAGARRYSTAQGSPLLPIRYLLFLRREWFSRDVRNLGVNENNFSQSNAPPRHRQRKVSSP